MKRKYVKNAVPQRYSYRKGTREVYSKFTTENYVNAFSRKLVMHHQVFHEGFWCTASECVSEDKCKP